MLSNSYVAIVASLEQSRKFRYIPRGRGHLHDIFKRHSLDFCDQEGLDAVVLNKIDNLRITTFGRDKFWDRIKILNPKAAHFEVSCTSGAGFDTWAEWPKGKL